MEFIQCLQTNYYQTGEVTVASHLCQYSLTDLIYYFGSSKILIVFILCFFDYIWGWAHCHMFYVSFIITLGCQMTSLNVHSSLWTSMTRSVARHSHLHIHTFVFFVVFTSFSYSILISWLYEWEFGEMSN